MTSNITVVELRQYTLHGGRRDELIALFEREFIESQEAEGIRLLGAFRDLDDPDRLVWMRGFSDMASRKMALQKFYGGAVWKAHRDAANATMLDSDNVLLLQPLPRSEGLLAPRRGAESSVVRVAIHTLRDVDPSLFAEFFDSRMRPLIELAGAGVLAGLVTEPAVNDFRLPVREHEPVFVWLARFPDEAAERRFSAQMAEATGWRDGAQEAILPALMRKPEVLRLSPTARSPLS
jgi:hypothetical protein